METLQINTHLHAVTALSLGLTEHGKGHVAPTAAELLALTSEQRTELARYVTRATLCNYLELSAPGWAGVIEAIDAIIEKKRAEAEDRERCIERERESFRGLLTSGRYYEAGLPLREITAYGPNYSRDDPEAQRLWAAVEAARRAERARIILEADAALAYATDAESSGKPSPEIRRVLEAAQRWVGGGKGYAFDPIPARAVEFEARARAEDEAAKAQIADGTRRLERGLLTDYGTVDQVERYDAGVLPADEFVRVAKARLFAPLVDFATYARLDVSDVEHSDECYEGKVKFRSEEYTGPLSADQWARLQELRTAVPEGAAVELREHTAYCSSCDEIATRLGARVTIEWAGEKYAREYSVD